MWSDSARPAHCKLGPSSAGPRWRRDHWLWPSLVGFCAGGPDLLPGFPGILLVSRVVPLDWSPEFFPFTAGPDLFPGMPCTPAPGARRIGHLLAEARVAGVAEVWLIYPCRGARRSHDRSSSPEPGTAAAATHSPLKKRRKPKWRPCSKK
jgi:hypothetical protein